MVLLSRAVRRFVCVMLQALAEGVPTWQRLGRRASLYCQSYCVAVLAAKHSVPAALHWQGRAAQGLTHCCVQGYIIYMAYHLLHIWPTTCCSVKSSNVQDGCIHNPGPSILNQGKLPLCVSKCERTGMSTQQRPL